MFSLSPVVRVLLIINVLVVFVTINNGQLSDQLLSSLDCIRFYLTNSIQFSY